MKCTNANEMEYSNILLTKNIKEKRKNRRIGEGAL